MGEVKRAFVKQFQVKSGSKPHTAQYGSCVVFTTVDGVRLYWDTASTKILNMIEFDGKVLSVPFEIGYKVVRELGESNFEISHTRFLTPSVEQVNTYVEQGYVVGFYTVDQYENGYKAEVDAGIMPRYTYTVYIDFEDEMIWDYSVDDLQKGLEMAVTWLNNGKPIQPDLL